jgi:sirohydrochlorin ferrochelatase
MGASNPLGLCCKERVIQHLYSEMGASPRLRRGDRAIRLYLLPGKPDKRIPLLSLARIKSGLADGTEYWTCSTTYFTEPWRVRVVEQVSQNAPHFANFIRNLFNN